MMPKKRPGAEIDKNAIWAPSAEMAKNVVQGEPLERLTRTLLAFVVICFSTHFRRSCSGTPRQKPRENPLQRTLYHTYTASSS